MVVLGLLNRMTSGKVSSLVWWKNLHGCVGHGVAHGNGRKTNSNGSVKVKMVTGSLTRPFDVNLLRGNIKQGLIFGVNAIFQPL